MAITTPKQFAVLQWLESEPYRVLSGDLGEPPIGILRRLNYRGFVAREGFNPVRWSLTEYGRKVLKREI
jgi:hypothetical protein